MSSTTTSLRFAILITAASGFLDAYTMLARGGVFANAQTGNVVLLALSLARGHWQQAAAYLWPLLAFGAGIVAAVHVRQGRLDNLLAHPLRWVVAVQVLVLVVVGFVPSTVPPSWVTVPITFTAAMVLELFRSIGARSYVAIATTGNLMRWVEAWYSRMTTGTSGSRVDVRIYSMVVAAFAGGAIIGAFATRLLGVHASWLPAGILAATLMIFVLDERAEVSIPGTSAEIAGTVSDAPRSQR